MTLSAIKNRLKVLVAAVPTMNGRPVLIEAKGNLVNDLETALQTNQLAAVVALSGGENRGTARRERAAWDETFEVVIHRGQLDGDDVPATDDVLEELRNALQGALLDPTKEVGNAFNCRRHDLRDGGDGSYARVLTVGLTHAI